MYVLRVEHVVPDYDAWRAAFDSDPIGREKAGVVRYRVLRATDDPNIVMIDLEFASAAEADQMHESLKKLWGRVDVMRDPSARSAEIVATHEY